MRNLASLSKHSSKDLQNFGKVNIAAVIDSGYKLLLEKHNNPVKKQKFCVKS